MVFVSDAQFDGRKLRMLTVVDCFTRESLATYLGHSPKGEDVVQSLNRTCAVRGLPRTIKTVTAANSSPRPWTVGHMNAASGWISVGQASRRGCPRFCV